jgi:hypothetical protein
MGRRTDRIAAYADGLNTRIKPEQLAAWQKGTPTDWANESHLLARNAPYAGVPADGPPPKLDQKYVDANAVVIEQQLERGGVRLATVLNRDLLDGNSSPDSPKSN